ncbi:hypothetical protein SAMN05192541_12978 [Bradyrhizobium arachidis]|nr:hypothetical protein SAMN05192541_12978 [Bradyrhizobium arachidis]
MAEALAHPASLQPVTKLTIRQKRDIVPGLRKQLQEWSEVGHHPNQRRHTLSLPNRPLERSTETPFCAELRDSCAMISGTSPRIQESTRTSSPKRLSAQQRLLEVTPTRTTIQIAARFYSYRLGDEIVGLLRAGGPARIKGDHFQQQFGRNDITSVVDLRVTHPLVENAGDILLEHQLREDGDQPLILSRPALAGMEPRLADMGFVPVGRNHWVLDPHQRPDVWAKNENDEWQRVGKPTKYLSKDGGSDLGPQRSYETDSSDDDPSFYLERALWEMHME